MGCEVRSEPKDDHRKRVNAVVLPTFFDRHETVPDEELAEGRQVIPAGVLRIHPDAIACQALQDVIQLERVWSHDTEETFGPQMFPCGHEELARIGKVLDDVRGNDEVKCPA